MKKIRLRIHQIKCIVKYFYYKLYCSVKKIENKDVWIISERGDEARDNGYAFYKYMIQKKPQINFKYIINKNSEDRKRIDDSRIVYQGSKEHYILFITAGYLLSTHIMGYSPEFRIFNKLDKWGWINIFGKRIYLTHGIDKDNVEGLDCKHIKVDLFVCGAKPQYEEEIKKLGHPKGVLQYIGMPRYDYLENDLKNQILLMPTWRMDLFYCKGIKEFKESNYYKNWNGILENKKLTEILEKNDLNLIFYPHYEIQPYIDAFNIKNNRIKIASIKDYDVQTLLNQSNLLVTDYSSVMFDFAYLRKPVIYFQFDYQEYRNNHFKEGYFSYLRDGFGDVLTDVNDVVDDMKSIIEKNFEVDDKYILNRDRFFTLPVGGNSERVYRAILNCKKNYYR